MRPEFLRLLICPECGGELNLTPFRSAAPSGDQIEEGLLLCQDCSYPYPVTAGIPRLLPNSLQRHPEFFKEFSRELRDLRFRNPGVETIRRFENLHQLTARAFGYEWTTYPTTSREEDIITFFWLTGADPDLYRKLHLTDVFTFYPTEQNLSKVDGSRLAGATILDIGCGMGKYLMVVSELAKEVIGLDLSDALLLARALTRERPNIHLVQANILSPPLRPESVDFAYSVGVLHHTPDARQAFLRSTSLVKPGGQLAIWVYPTELNQSRYAKWVHWIQDDVLRPITCRMPPRVLRVFAALLGRLTFIRDRFASQYAVTGSRLAYYVAMSAGAVAVGQHKNPEIAAFLNFDWYSPQYRSYHSEDEVMRWYREAGFDPVTLLPQRVSAVGTKRVRA